jgi:hypothetical protein
MRMFNGISWLPEQQLTSSTSNGLTPALVQQTNGNIMLVWTSNMSGNYSLYYKTYAAGVWSSPSRLTTPQGRDSTPSLVQMRNGTVLLYWTRESLSGTVVRYIYYKSYTNGLWSKEARFSTGGTEEEPSVYQTDDGTIWVVYAANRFGNLDIFYKTYNGSWSSEVRLTTNTADDRQSWLTQDLNGMLWEFWTRCVPLSGGTCEDKIFYITSSNLGATWSPEVQFTFDPTGYIIYDSHPAAIHYERDKMMYVFWGTDLTGPGVDFDVWLRTSNPIPIHDVSVSNATSSPTLLQQGGTVRSNFTANNPGDYNETLTINSLYQNSTSVIFKTTTMALRPGRSAFVQTWWNTTISAPAKYQIVVFAVPVFGESVRLWGGNRAVAGNVTVQRIPEDIDGDGRVDIIDLALVAVKFGMTTLPEDVNHDCRIDIVDLAIVANHFGTKLGDPNWYAPADVDRDGYVDINDLARVAFRYGTTMGPEDIDHDCTVDIVDLAAVAVRYGFGM